MIRQVLYLFVGTVFSGYISSCTSGEQIVMSSPDEQIILYLSTSGGESGDQLIYNVKYRDRLILSECELGINFVNMGEFGKGLSILSIDHTTVDEEYSMPQGKTSLIRNHYNQKIIELEEGATDRRYSLVFRIYNDGIGFRYRIPDQAGVEEVQIREENTAFNFTSDSKYWGLHLNSFNTGYEEEYTVDVLTEMDPSDIIGLPLLVRESAKTWVAITEAALVNYAGMYLKSDQLNSTQLVTALSPLPDKSGVSVTSKVPMVTPWRVIMIGDTPGRLVESNIVLNLNEPCLFDDSWVKPGLAINDWTNDQTIKEGGFEGAMDNRTMKYYIDFCADYGLPYMSIDAGWYEKEWSNGRGDLTKTIPEIDMPMLVEYAADRGVEIFVWTYGDVMRRQMDEAMQQFVKWGIKGFNVDFNDRDDQEMVNSINLITKKAAEYGLHVEFHGIYKPTGLSRTYPNLLAHEGVLGLEYAKWDRKPTPEHNCIIPFTRMLAGPLDYIPVGFTNATRNEYQVVYDEFQTLGTRCHQLAHLVIFESGFQVLADYPDNYRNAIGSDLFKHIPAAWDETEVLNASVGDYITIARRKGQEWFIGSNTDWTQRELTVALSFLNEGQYEAEIYSDGDNANEVATSIDLKKRNVAKNDTIQIKMASGGGYIARIYPVN